jgi:proteasome lid subunit RPN8/RPN11
MDHWLLLEDLQFLSEMQLVHLACIHNAPFDVIHCLSSLFPGSLTLKNNKGYTPLMYALEKKRDEDIIQCVTYSNLEAIGDFDQGNRQWAKFAMVNEHFGDESCIDSEMAMFWLKHKDPMLTCLVVGDRFHCSHPKESDGLFNSSPYERAVMDILDAVYSHPHITELSLAMDDHNSILWREGNALNAMISVLRDLLSTTAILIRTLLSRPFVCTNPGKARLHSKMGGSWKGV